MYLYIISIAVIIPEMTTELFSVFSYALRATRTGFHEVKEFISI